MLELKEMKNSRVSMQASLHEKLVATKGARSNRSNTPPDNRSRDNIESDGNRMMFGGNSGDCYESEETYIGYSSRRQIPRCRAYEDERRWRDHGHGYQREMRAYEYERHVGYEGYEGYGGYTRGSYNEYTCEPMNHDDKHGRNRRYEDKCEPSYDDPTRNIKHTLSEFHGKLDLEVYLEWESQVEKIYSLHNYSDEDKVKIYVAKFRGYANSGGPTLCGEKY